MPYLSLMNCKHLIAHLKQPSMFQERTVPQIPQNVLFYPVTPFEIFILNKNYCLLSFVICSLNQISVLDNTTNPQLINRKNIYSLGDLIFPLRRSIINFLSLESISLTELSKFLTLSCCFNKNTISPRTLIPSNASARSFDACVIPRFSSSILSNSPISLFSSNSQSL